MGNNTAGEKPKFDLITASKSKKYKIITAVVLIIGVLLLGGGLLMRSFVTSAVAPNNLKLSNLSGRQSGENYIITKDEPFFLSTGNFADRALTTPITFTLMDGAEDFLEVCNADMNPITRSYYAGQFWLHVLDDAPVTDQNGIRPTGTLVITCGSHTVIVRFTYYAEE